MKKIILTILTFSSTLMFSQEEEKVIPFGDYWYDGKAEISTYKLSQGRYGELRDGIATNIFVTENFSKKSFTKADRGGEDNVKVLKLNKTKKFITGIYPYSVMTSSFTELESAKSCLKLSTSIQEWCGHDYLELLNDGKKTKIENKSYHQGESFKDKEIEKNVVIEDNLWSIIRMNPLQLPKGKQMVLPSLVFLRFSHLEVKPYEANFTMYKKENTFSYEIDYPALNRTLIIKYNDRSPYIIEGWEEISLNGKGAKRKILTTKAELIKTMKIDYWNKNTNEDLPLRKELGL